MAVVNLRMCQPSLVCGQRRDLREEWQHKKVIEVKRVRNFILWLGYLIVTAKILHPRAMNSFFPLTQPHRGLTLSRFTSAIEVNFEM